MIYIITTCSRPENLALMRDSIPEECTWVVVFDRLVGNPPPVDGAITLYSPFTGSVGMPNRNYALDTLEFSDSDWIYVLDDDNIIHPDWYKSVTEAEKDQLLMMSWGQVWKNQTVRLYPTSYPQVGNVDTASYMVRGSLMRTLRYHLDYVADGILAQEAFEHCAPGQYLVLDRYLAYSNYLRTPPDRE